LFLSASFQLFLHRLRHNIPVLRDDLQGLVEYANDNAGCGFDVEGRVNREQHYAQSPAQRQRILELLLERGPEGATNVELKAICFRYGVRIWELRRVGLQIRTENLGDGFFQFVLISSQLPNSNVGVRRDATSKDDAEPEDPHDYARRTRELRDQAMPLFAVRK
jgi:hypothetical protein